MIIVGLGKAYHDSSICIFDSGKIKYAKYEREVNINEGDIVPRRGRVASNPRNQ